MNTVKNWNDFTVAFGAGEGTCERLVAKHVFKYTQCGCVFVKLPDGVSFAGYAEGSDADCTEHRLTYPFQMADFWSELEEADAEGVALWHESNDGY